uniref:Uncharacterized protein n=1 Tax=Avena sativa TaxID=4498 RepID=A0ACD5Z324_AVESA
MSSCEAEYVAAASAACQAVWLRRLLSDMTGAKDSATMIYIDNKSAIQLCKNPVFHDRSKHIEVRYHFIRDCIVSGKIDVEHVSMGEHLADILTKPLARVRFQELRTRLGMVIINGQLSNGDAHRLLDGMPLRKKDESAPRVSGADRIGSLPDHPLHHVLSFLPAHTAVRACVLTRRWHDLWRSTIGLRIVGLDGPNCARDLWVFVDHLLILRERTDLDTVEIKFDHFHGDDDLYLKLRTPFALMCKVRVLTIHLDGPSYHYLDGLPLASRQLRILDLEGVSLGEDFLDFASCPALEDLKMNLCEISVDEISSRSLKHLSITRCYSESGSRVHVSTPGLVSLSLKLDGFSGPIPFLDNMASLESARVHLQDDCEDDCLNYESGVPYGVNNRNNNACENCDHVNDDCSSSLLLLGSISSAKHVELISECGKLMFARYLKHCPTFVKLKTLLLNEYWCEAPDLDPLACVLKDSPVLEKLTLQLFSKGPNHKVEMKGSYSSMERSSAISGHLNIVEVKCNVVDGSILKVLKFLCAFNISKLR